VQGEGYEIAKTLGANVKFTGKSLSLQETNQYYVTLHINGHDELYCFDTPKVNVCNLIFGEAYVEPVGNCLVKCHTTGESCEIEFKARGWTAKSRELVSAVVKDKSGAKKFKIEGRFTESLSITDLTSNEVLDTWNAPESIDKAD
jgi:splicing suppressor protein 51